MRNRWRVGLLLPHALALGIVKVISRVRRTVRIIIHANAGDAVLRVVDVTVRSIGGRVSGRCSPRTKCLTRQVLIKVEQLFFKRVI